MTGPATYHCRKERDGWSTSCIKAVIWRVTHHEATNNATYRGLDGHGQSLAILLSDQMTHEEEDLQLL